MPPKPVSAAELERMKSVRIAAGADADDFVWVTAAEGDGSGDKKLARFSMTAYTGVPMRVGFRWPVVVDLAGLEVSAKPTPILKDHDPSKIVGHTDSIDKGQNRRLKVEGTISGVGDAAQEVIALGGNGFPWQTSIGAEITQMEFVDRGEKVNVNGRSIAGPVFVARKSRLREVSFVAIGADSETLGRVAASQVSNRKGETMDFEQWLAAKGFDVATLSDDQKTVLQAAYDAEQKPKEKGEKKPEQKPAKDGGDAGGTVNASGESVDITAQIRAEAAKETKRIADVTRICKDFPDIQAKAIEEGWDVVKAEVAVLRAERDNGPAIHVAPVVRDAKADVIEAAMCQALGLPEIEKAFEAKTLEASHRMFRGRIGLQQILMLVAAQNGYPAGPGERINTGNYDAVLRAAFSTVSLPGILSNVANKELLAGYMEEDQTWREIAQVKNVSDFKTVTSYRLLDELEYEELPKHGRIQHGTVGEETMTRSARTYAKMLSLDRVDIINDDLGAFDDLRARLGRGAARKFNAVFWSTFMDNGSFFTTGNGNYIEGAGTAFDINGAGLQEGITAFRQRESADGKRIGGSPDRVLVPPELEFIALRLYQSTLVNTGGSSSNSTVPNANIHAGKYRPVVVNQLSDSTYTGYSDKAWYLFGDPRILAPMVVSFLNGVQTPTVEASAVQFDQLGIQLRGYHDFGCDKAEKLAGIKSKGAAA